MSEFFTGDVVTGLTIFALAAAAAFMPKIFEWLKAKAAKTTTMTDDEFLISIEGIVKTKLDEALAKQKAKKTTK